MRTPFAPSERLAWVLAPLDHAAQIEAKDFSVVRRLLREAGELGFLSLDIPEEHSGLGQDLTTSALVGDAMAVLGSWSIAFGDQVGVGTLPIIYFGAPAQQARYLPRIASGECVSAYALSEPSCGSDALAVRTRAVLSSDEDHWILNGTKQWISNAGFADVFVIFAKVLESALERGELARGDRLARERRVAELNKAIFVFVARVAIESSGPGVGERQEVLGALADVAIEAYAVDSAVSRALQAEPNPVAEACVKLYAEEAHQRVHSRARGAVLASTKDPSKARAHLATLRRLLDDEPVDVVAWREIVVAATLDEGKYPLAWM